MNNSIDHSGVKGMKWGVRNSSSKGGGKKNKTKAQKAKDNVTLARRISGGANIVKGLALVMSAPLVANPVVATGAILIGGALTVVGGIDVKNAKK